jgi:hypothetical protein
VRRLLLAISPIVLCLVVCVSSVGVAASRASGAAPTGPCRLLSDAQMSSALGATVHSTSTTGTGLTCTYWVHANDASAGWGSLFFITNSAEAATEKKHDETTTTTVTGFTKHYLTSRGQLGPALDVRVKGLGEIAGYDAGQDQLDVLTPKDTFSIVVNKTHKGTAAHIPEPTLISLGRDVLKKL